MSDRMPVILGSKIPYGRGSLEGAEPPYADGLPHGRIGPAIPGDAGSWMIVPVDAPQDGRSYVRQNRLWVVEGSQLPLPPNIGQPMAFIRRTIDPISAWVVVPDEAPSNNQLYARENQTWVALPSFIGEAPSNANVYGRGGGQWLEVVREVLANILDATWAFGRLNGQWYEVPLDLLDDIDRDIPFARLKPSVAPGYPIWVRTVEEAPLDTTLRGRQNGQWVPIVLTGGIPEPPLDATLYGRGGQPLQAPTWQRCAPEAPGGTIRYVRVGGTWQPDEIQDDAPNNANLYGRRGQQWVQIPELPTDAPINATLYARGGTPVTDVVPRWQQIPVQTEAPIDVGNPANSNVYGRRNAQWQEVPEEAPPNMIAYARRNHQWVPFAEYLFGVWQVVTLSFPANWQAGSELRMRTIGTSQVEFIGSLVPAAAIPGNGAIAVGQPLILQPSTPQYATLVATNGGVRTIAGIRNAASGLLTIFGLGPGFDSIPDIHFIFALGSTAGVEED